jgi:hypothetical protein
MRSATALLGASLCSLLLLATATPARAATVTITGPEQIVFDYSTMACVEGDVPDGPARAFKDVNDQIQLIRPGANKRMIGPSFDNLTSDCTLLKSSALDPFPGDFDFAVWMTGTYTADGTTVQALLHSEFHGTRVTGMCPSGSIQPCRYNSATLATSTDVGASYTSTPAPTQLVASIPYRYTPEVGRVGIFSPSNIITKAGYFYAMVLVGGERVQRGGVCLMRTQDLSDPTSWRAWDGAGFTVRFIDPYLEPSANPNTHACQPVASDQIGQIERSLTYNSYLNKYFVIGTESKIDPGTQQPVRGFYYSFSDDLIHWSDRQLLLETPDVSCDGSPFLAYPSVIDHNSSDRNFGTAGQNAYLYYVVIHTANCGFTKDRDMVRVPIQFAP